MICTEGKVDLRITDNGQGFNMDSARPGSLGLSIMQERAEAIGAELTIKSVRGEGTRVSVIWVK
jgi:two-component system, NarL family, sensor histidine kinase LiaS